LVEFLGKTQQKSTIHTLPESGCVLPNSAGLRGVLFCTLRISKMEKEDRSMSPDECIENLVETKEKEIIAEIYDYYREEKLKEEEDKEWYPNPELSKIVVEDWRMRNIPDEYLINECNVENEEDSLAEYRCVLDNAITSVLDAHYERDMEQYHDIVADKETELEIFFNDGENEVWDLVSQHEKDTYYRQKEYCRLASSIRNVVLERVRALVDLSPEEMEKSAKRIDVEEIAAERCREFYPPTMKTQKLID
jgi:hypothetical protein